MGLAALHSLLYFVRSLFYLIKGSCFCRQWGHVHYSNGDSVRLSSPAGIWRTWIRMGSWKLRNSSWPCIWWTWPKSGSPCPSRCLWTSCHLHFAMKSLGLRRALHATGFYTVTIIQYSLRKNWSSLHFSARDLNFILKYVNLFSSPNIPS